jgi:hypothetical protein
MALAPTWGLPAWLARPFTETSRPAQTAVADGHIQVGRLGNHGEIGPRPDFPADHAQGSGIASGLFIAHRLEGDAAFEGRAAFLQGPQGDDHGGHPGFHVARPAAVNETILVLSAEGVYLPILSRRDHVKVAVPDQGLAVFLPAKLGNHVGHAGFILDDLRRKPPGLELLGNDPRALPHVPGGVQALGANHPGEESTRVIRIDEFLKINHFPPQECEMRGESWELIKNTIHTSQLSTHNSQLTSHSNAFTAPNTRS